MTKVQHYVNNKDFTKAVVQYQKECRKARRESRNQPPMTKYIGECITQICMRLTVGPKFNFISYTYLDEMQRDAIERCCYAILKFKANKTKVGAFGYMTTVAVNAMKKRIQDEKKQNYAKHKYFQTLYMQQDLDGAGVAPNEHSDKVINDFEDSLKRKAKAVKLSLTLRKKKAKLATKRKRRKREK